LPPYFLILSLSRFLDAMRRCRSRRYLENTLWAYLSTGWSGMLYSRVAAFHLMTSFIIKRDMTSFFTEMLQRMAAAGWGAGMPLKFYSLWLDFHLVVLCTARASLIKIVGWMQRSTHKRENA
jgi:hypothetical protein